MQGRKREPERRRRERERKALYLDCAVPHPACAAHPCPLVVFNGLVDISQRLILDPQMAGVARSLAMEVHQVGPACGAHFFLSSPAHNDVAWQERPWHVVPGDAARTPSRSSAQTRHARGLGPPHRRCCTHAPPLALGSRAGKQALRLVYSPEGSAWCARDVVAVQNAVKFRLVVPVHCLQRPQLAIAILSGVRWSAHE
jgi:hypothetical protein